MSELDLDGSADLPGRSSTRTRTWSEPGRSQLVRWEGLPSVLIEALYCGVPIVSTDCPSGPVEILDGGAHGLLVPVQIADALADGIDAALDGRS